MRRRSKTNSRPQENLALRDSYRNTVFACELCGDSMWSDIHHIWHRAGRWDVISNLIGLCRDCHLDTAHAKPIEGKLACLYIKLWKGELDIDEINQCAGMNVGGWLEFPKVVNCAPGYNDRRLRLVEFFEQGGKRDG